MPSVPVRLLASWLLSGIVLAILSWDLGFAAAVMMASSVFAVPGLLIASLLHRQIAAAPLVWTAAAFVIVTVVAFLLTGLLAIFSFFVSVPTAVLFLSSAPVLRWWRQVRRARSGV